MVLELELEIGHQLAERAGERPRGRRGACSRARRAAPGSSVRAAAPRREAGEQRGEARRDVVEHARQPLVESASPSAAPRSGAASRRSASRRRRTRARAARQLVAASRARRRRGIVPREAHQLHRAHQTQQLDAARGASRSIAERLAEPRRSALPRDRLDDRALAARERGASRPAVRASRTRGSSSTVRNFAQLVAALDALGHEAARLERRGARRCRAASSPSQNTPCPPAQRTASARSPRPGTSRRSRARAASGSRARRAPCRSASGGGSALGLAQLLEGSTPARSRHSPSRSTIWFERRTRPRRGGARPTSRGSRCVKLASPDFPVRSSQANTSWGAKLASSAATEGSPAVAPRPGADVACEPPRRSLFVADRRALEGR